MNQSQAPNRRKRARQPDAGHRMRRYTLFSVGFHVLTISLLSFPSIRHPRPMPAEPIYEVALVQWPEPNFQPPTPARTPPKEKPKPAEPEKPRPEPKPQEVVIPKKTEAKPKPVEKQPPPEPKVETTPKPVETPDVPTEPVSLGQVDQRDFKHDYYLQLLRGILARAWDPPSEGEGLMKTSLHFTILRDGTIVAPEIIGESGWVLFDRAALRAVLSVKKLPPLPEAYAGNELGLTVDFQTMMGAP